MKISNMIVLVVVTVSIILGWGSLHLYTQISEPIANSKAEVLSYLKANNTEFANLKQVNFYHGTESYQVFEGTNAAAKEVFIWITKSLDNQIVMGKNAGLGFAEVTQFVEQELNPKEIISIKLGIENSIPLYEIIYIDDQDRYSYYYISFKDGTYLKHYHLNV